jgi:hypothetical protein
LLFPLEKIITIQTGEPVSGHLGAIALLTKQEFCADLAYLKKSAIMVRTGLQKSLYLSKDF